MAGLPFHGSRLRSTQQTVPDSTKCRTGCNRGGVQFCLLLGWKWMLVQRHSRRRCCFQCWATRGRQCALPRPLFSRWNDECVLRSLLRLQTLCLVPLDAGCGCVRGNTPEMGWKTRSSGGTRLEAGAGKWESVDQTGICSVQKFP